MIRIAYALFVASALIVSSQVRAEISPVHIGNIQIDGQTLDLLIEGALPTPCHAQPSASLVPSAKDSRVLILRLSSPIPMNFCVSRIQEYDLVVSLPGLAQASRLPLDAEQVYTVKAEGYQFAIEILGSNLMR